MIISHKHKFIFIHLHKCAGTSVTKALIPYLGRDDTILGCTPKYEKLSNQSRERGSLHKHSTAQQIRQHVGEAVWREYFVFSFVRNPWEIVLSKYFWWHKTPADWNDIAATQKARIMAMTFPEFVASLGKKAGFMDSLLSAPADTGEVVSQPALDFDFIGRQETIEQDFQEACQRIPLPAIRLYKDNVSSELRKEHTYSHYYDSQAEVKVRKIYAREIKEFGYEFDG